MSNPILSRHYATLYFVFAVDSQESDLGILDLIQVFVESLDKCFCNVCELDLIFHSDKVHYVLDEIVSGGMVLETNISMVLESVKKQGKLGKTGKFGEAEVVRKFGEVRGSWGKWLEVGG